MFPIHCAVMGGSVDLVRWLVETHLVPISVPSDLKTGSMVSVQTSASRTLLDIAMTGVRPKVDILVFLVRKGLCITDVKDTSLIPKTFEAILKAGGSVQDMSVVTTPETEGGRHMVVDDETATAVDENACCLCYERPMDCVLTPCGHQMCCTECGDHLSSCPVCKVQCSVLRVFRW
jgi:hypothetical protein